jgi:hypothetical protein
VWKAPMNFKSFSSYTIVGVLFVVFSVIGFTSAQAKVQENKYAVALVIGNKG